MTDDQAAGRRLAARAIDDALTGRDPNAISKLMHALADATEASIETEREQRAARRRTPEARLRRAQAAHAGWTTRRTRESAERAELDARHGPDIGNGPWCGAMNHDSTGREVFCYLAPGHDGDCDDFNGCTWEDEDE